MLPPSASTRASTITTNTVGTSTTAATFTSVSSFLPPRAEQRIHIWLSEVSPSPILSRSLKSDSSTHLAYYAHEESPFLQTLPTLNHGRVSIAQLYATREKGPSLKQRLRKLTRFGRKDKVWGFEGERVGGDLRAVAEVTAMYDLEVSEVAPRASFQIEAHAAASAARGVDGMGSTRKGGDDDIVRLNGSDFGAGLVGQRRLMDQEFRRARRLSAV